MRILSLMFAVMMAIIATPAFANDADLTVFGSPANVYVSLQGGQGTAPESSNATPDNTALSAAVGLDFGSVRLEGEFLNLDSGKGGKTSDINAMAVNVLAEPVKIGSFVPYVGVGAGYALMEGQAIRDNKDGIFYNVLLGASYDITDTWALTAGYRYMVSADQRVTRNDGTADDFTQHVYTAGFRYTF